jgi:hypothetical protein
MTEPDDEYNQSNDDNDYDNDSDGRELVIDDRIDKQQRAEQQRVLTEIAQSAQDASDELRLMNDNIENLAREVHGTKEAIKSLTDMLKKYLDIKN